MDLLKCRRRDLTDNTVKVLGCLERENEDDDDATEGNSEASAVNGIMCEV